MTSESLPVTIRKQLDKLDDPLEGALIASAVFEFILGRHATEEEIRRRALETLSVEERDQLTALFFAPKGAAVASKAIDAVVDARRDIATAWFMLDWMRVHFKAVGAAPVRWFGQDLARLHRMALFFLELVRLVCEQPASTQVVLLEHLWQYRLDSLLPGEKPLPCPECARQGRWDRVGRLGIIRPGARPAVFSYRPLVPNAYLRRLSHQAQVPLPTHRPRAFVWLLNDDGDETREFTCARGHRVRFERDVLRKKYGHAT